MAKWSKHIKRKRFTESSHYKEDTGTKIEMDIPFHSLKVKVVTPKSKKERNMGEAEQQSGRESR